MRIRNVIAEDYYYIAPVINDWWGGRQMMDMLPKLFFDHFNDTSFIAEKDGEYIGFLIGFLSQSKPTEAYIHFVGVHPEFRSASIGKKLYETFFKEVQLRGITRVRAVTSPINQTSISFHNKMGFMIETGDKVVDGLSVYSNYDGIGQDRVLFLKDL
ncbi:GNAT family N-acetyltransferase [Cytobacillus horneckiae]|uniref:N-acetyltransferase n=1 Tax=Cytobacillus horneckiae TaxID=549687 RepID=A0A2N0ZMP5_9BACI|nr:GNAT family N-acetyltransferase [Cytobacillus horneckiae]MCM3176560.1 GNAT family N-acetyltransferase [Cytobacillus horneckiae]MEC1159112.1 GNAT family N-acetyltransferase [Cytobacillus horneckiae]MED2938804.1 GNAT family N-acetyltransferase [Cytobacillus horneckiae]PKG30782.1 N-acetyltransferase [Cytobacillus horneckiae]